MHQFPLIRREMRAVVGLFGLSFCATAWSCSSASGDRQAGTQTQAGPSNVSSATGGSATDLALGLSGTATTAQAGSAGQADSAVCNAQVRDGQRVPIDMYFLVDSSGSMNEPVSGGSKWAVVSSSLVAFLNDPRNVDTGVGIGYFPSAPNACMPGQTGCLCIPLINICFSTVGGSCTVGDYAKPAVALGLPPTPAQVVSDIGGHGIGGGTPTRPALEGALQYLGQWATEHPERKPLLVLATDGEPSECELNTPQDVADVAARALAGPQAIRTFVIGVGSSLVSLNLVAQAGGTDHAFLVDTGGDVTKEFADALDQIRGAATSCEFSIPKTGSGNEPINPSKVNVSYIASGNNTATQVPQTYMGDANNCDSSGGWYYDNAAAPTSIKLCDATCRSLSGSSIQVAFGCDTVMRPPR
jgi:Mg-chelatase subunit ChlD